MLGCCFCGSPSPEATQCALGTSPARKPLLRMRWGRLREHPTFVEAQMQDVPVKDVELGLCFTCNGFQYTLAQLLGRGAHCSVWRCLRISRDEPRSANADDCAFVNFLLLMLL